MSEGQRLLLPMTDGGPTKRHANSFFSATRLPLSTNKSMALVLSCLVLYWFFTSTEVMTPDKIAAWSADKTIVITGANSVVAYGALVHLLRANTAEHIIMACRNQERCQETLVQAQAELKLSRGQQGAIRALPSQQRQRQPAQQEMQSTKVSTVSLDLTSHASIQQCAEAIRGITQQRQQGHTEHSNTETNMILVWNANDSIHDPIRVNGFGHLYLTHLLYPQLQRIVVAASIVGGVPWNVVQPWDMSAASYPTWFHTPARYGTNKRAILFLAHHVLQSQLHRHSSHDKSNSSKPLQVMTTQAGLTCDATDDCSALSMTPHLGAVSHLRAMLDPDLQPGSYIGHRWVLWGKTIVAGSLVSSLYHMKLSQETGEQLWAWGMKELEVQDFGAPNPV